MEYVCIYNPSDYKINLDLSQSLGERLKYYVYLDGKWVYEGRNQHIPIVASDGEHSIKVNFVDKGGNREIVEMKVKVSSTGPRDMRILLILLILAFFPYKVWKNHG